MGFWQEHDVVLGIVFLIFITFFPRITMRFAVAIPFGWGAWVGWLFVPHITVAVYATKLYWQTNPVLCVIGWFVAVVGTIYNIRNAPKLFQNLNHPLVGHFLAIASFGFALHPSFSWFLLGGLCYIAFQQFLDLSLILNSTSSYKNAFDTYLNRPDVYRIEKQQIPEGWVEDDPFDSVSLKRLSRYYFSQFYGEPKAANARPHEDAFTQGKDLDHLKGENIIVYYCTNLARRVTVDWQSFVNPFGAVIILAPQRLTPPNPVKRFLLLHEIGHVRRYGNITWALRTTLMNSAFVLSLIIFGLARGHWKLFAVIYFIESFVYYTFTVWGIKTELFADLYALKRIPENDRELALQFLAIKYEAIAEDRVNKSFLGRRQGKLYLKKLNRIKARAKVVGWHFINENPYYSGMVRHWLYLLLICYVVSQNEGVPWFSIIVIWIVNIIIAMFCSVALKALKGYDSRLNNIIIGETGPSELLNEGPEKERHGTAD
jgi:hypothetical protein